jgi:hypothetical protein
MELVEKIFLGVYLTILHRLSSENSLDLYTDPVTKYSGRYPFRESEGVARRFTIFDQ